MVKPADFLRHALTMMTGTALAQAIPIFVAPALTRFYSPAQFGIFSTIVAAAAILSVLSTLRLEVAIVLPAQGTTAAELVWAAIAMSLCVCAVAGLAIELSPQLVGRMLGAASEIVLLIPALALLMAWNQIAVFLANREKAYGAIAGGTIVQQGMAAGIALVLGLLAMTGEGLLIARIAGLGLGTLLILFLVRRWLRTNLRPTTFSATRNSVFEYRQFPLFNLPYSLVGTFSREFMILAFTAAHQLGPAGYYGLARSVLVAPVSFLSSSLSQVFYREAAESIGTPAFTRLTLTLLHLIAAAFTPFFGLGAFWAPQIFTVVFGARWQEAGYYAAALMPIALLGLFTSWPERVYEVRQKQHISLAIQVIFDTAAVAAVWSALAYGMHPIDAIYIYVGVEIVYHLMYLYAVFRFSEIHAWHYLCLVALIGVTFSLTVVVQVLFTTMPISYAAQFVSSAIFATAFAVTLLFLVRVNARKPLLAN